MKAPGLSEKVAPYEYEEYAMWDYETGYKLMTTEGKIIGIILFNFDDYFDAYAFYCSCGGDGNYGFYDVSGWDYGVEYRLNKITGEEGWCRLYEKVDLDSEGNERRYEDPYELWVVWHM